VSHSLLTCVRQHSHWLSLSLETCSLRLCMYVGRLCYHYCNLTLVFMCLKNLFSSSKQYLVSACHGKNVTESFVKNVSHQQYPVKWQCGEYW